LDEKEIVKPCHEKVYQEGSLYCLYNGDVVSTFSKDFFSPAYWQSIHAIAGTALGRGTTYFIHYQNNQWVLKHYYRGGLIGKLNKDSYLLMGIENTRAVKEFRLLQWMVSQKLPVPVPVACQINKGLFTYQADLITTRIENARDLVTILQTEVVVETTWQKIGQTIARFHRLGVYHDDLNCHNILLNAQGEIFIIDFDRGERRTPDKAWQRENLDRLLRSFNKELNRLKSFTWQDNQWQALIKGYQS
jgi:3-deoxy-D-manno-octulosonic acid kinase